MCQKYIAQFCMAMKQRKEEGRWHVEIWALHELWGKSGTGDMDAYDSTGLMKVLNTVEAMLAKDQRLLLVKSRRSSSRSWNLSAAAFHSRFHLAVVSSKALTAFSYSVLDDARLICVLSSFALSFLSSWPITMWPWARYPLIFRHSCS